MIFMETETPKGVRNLVNIFENRDFDQPRTNLKKTKSKSFTSLHKKHPPLADEHDEHTLNDENAKSQNFNEAFSKFEKPQITVPKFKKLVTNNDECVKLQEVRDIHVKASEIATKLKQFRKNVSTSYVSYLNQIVEMLLKLGQIETHGFISVQTEKLSTLQLLKRCHDQLKNKIQLSEGENVKTLDEQTMDELKISSNRASTLFMNAEQNKESLVTLERPNVQHLKSMFEQKSYVEKQSAQRGIIHRHNENRRSYHMESNPKPLTIQKQRSYVYERPTVTNLKTPTKDSKAYEQFEYTGITMNNYNEMLKSTKKNKERNSYSEYIVTHENDDKFPELQNNEIVNTSENNTDKFFESTSFLKMAQAYTYNSQEENKTSLGKNSIGYDTEEEFERIYSNQHSRVSPFKEVADMADSIQDSQDADVDKEFEDLMSSASNYSRFNGTHYE